MNRKGLQQIQGLHRAARQGDLNAVRRLLDRGYPVDAPSDESGRTGLEGRGSQGRGEGGRFPPQEGPTVNPPAKDRWAWFMAADFNGPGEINFFFPEHGADSRLK